MVQASESISIAVNGESREVSKGLTVRELLDRLEVKGRHVAVARNGELVPRSQYEATRVESGDRIEIVQAIGGGTA
ncbi:MAG: sulfur carrier protein ThiS [Nitrospinota bacterium]